MNLEGNEEVEVVEGSAPEQSSDAPEQPQVLDIDSLEKFRFGGKEWTPKDFQGAYMMQSDYTRKTQALAEDRKYYDNLSADLESVKKNPALAEKFKSVYPEKFHNFLGYVHQPQAEQPKEKAPQAGIDPEFMSRFERVEADLHDRKVQAINAELDNTFKSLSEKYPFADEEAAIARGQALLSQGQELTKDVWEKVWKSVHERNQALAEKHYSTKINQQKTANLAGRDVGRGGSTPGQGPKTPRTIKEASAYALQELEAN